MIEFILEYYIVEEYMDWVEMYNKIEEFIDFLENEKVSEEGEE